MNVVTWLTGIGFLVYIVFNLILYGAAVFVWLEPNVFEWNAWGRGVFAMLSIIAFIFFVLGPLASLRPYEEKLHDRDDSAEDSARGLRELEKACTDHASE